MVLQEGVSVNEANSKQPYLRRCHLANGISYPECDLTGVQYRGGVFLGVLFYIIRQGRTHRRPEENKVL